MTITYGSLFTGVGGFDLGFDRAGMQCAWQVEKDSYCLNLLNKRWPDVPKYGNITNVTGLPTVDLICGGFPCQDISVAGNREGLAGERSGLWFEFLRIITKLKPQWVVIENVPGLLSSNDGRDFATILRGLEKCGYWWAYRILDSQFFGVPQRRRRVFVVASLTRGLPQAVLFEPESSPWDSPPCRETGQGIAGAITKRFARNGGGANDDIDGKRLVIDARNGTTDDQITSTLQAKKQGYSLNAMPLVFDTTQVTSPGNYSSPKLGDPCHPQSSTAHPPAIAFGGNNTNGPIDTATACNAHPSRRYDFESETFICNAFNGYTGGADDNDAQGNHLIAFDHCLGGSERTYIHRSPDYAQLQANRPDSIYSSKQGVRRLTPLECERLQGFPDGWTEGQSDTQRYRQLGNAVTVNVIEWLGRRIVSISQGESDD